MNMNWSAVEKWFRRTRTVDSGISVFHEAVSIEQQQIIQIVDYDEMLERKIEFEELG